MTFLYKKKQLLGNLQLIKSVKPVFVKKKSSPDVTVSKISTSEEQIPSCNFGNDSSSLYTLETLVTQHAKDVLEKIDLSELNQQQQIIATQMVIEEAEAFSMSA